MVLIHSLALLLVDRGALLVMSDELQLDGDGQPYLLGGGGTLLLLDSLTDVLALRLTEALALLGGAPDQLTVLGRNSQDGGQQEGQQEGHLELHLSERS